MPWLKPDLADNRCLDSPQSVPVYQICRAAYDECEALRSVLLHSPFSAWSMAGVNASEVSEALGLCVCRNLRATLLLLCSDGALPCCCTVCLWYVLNGRSCLMLSCDTRAWARAPNMLRVRLSSAPRQSLTPTTTCKPFKAFRQCEAGGKVCSSLNWLLLSSTSKLNIAINRLFTR